MRKIILSFLLFLGVGSIQEAWAYSFKRIDNIFDAFQQTYIDKCDFKTATTNSLKTLAKADSSLKIYYSSTKAFLYQNQTLIGSYSFPKDNNDFSLWKEFITTVLEDSFNHSSELSSHFDKYELQIAKDLAFLFDSRARLESSTPKTSELNFKLTDNIIYIQVKQFDKGITEKIENIIKKYPESSGLILDLRHNRGGLINEAIKMAGLFLDNSIIMYSQEKERPRRYFISSKGDIFDNKEITLLIDEYTASAAEIVTAALSEQSRATTIGTKTFGKGSIQSPLQTPDGTLFVTNGYFFTPSGKNINNKGITPQICTGINGSCTINDKQTPDKTINTAINFIKNKLS